MGAGSCQGARPPEEVRQIDTDCRGTDLTFCGLTLRRLSPLTLRRRQRRRPAAPSTPQPVCSAVWRHGDGKALCCRGSARMASRRRNGKQGVEREMATGAGVP